MEIFVVSCDRFILSTSANSWLLSLQIFFLVQFSLFFSSLTPIVMLNCLLLLHTYWMLLFFFLCVFICVSLCFSLFQLCFFFEFLNLLQMNLFIHDIGTFYFPLGFFKKWFPWLMKLLLWLFTFSTFSFSMLIIIILKSGSGHPSIYSISGSVSIDDRIHFRAFFVCRGFNYMQNILFEKIIDIGVKYKRWWAHFSLRQHQSKL